MTFALIPARGGSKGLPGKNLRELGGKPLLVWTIEAALAAQEVACTVVSTDDPQIARCAWNAGAQVVDRPAALATDDARSEAALRHALVCLNAGNHHREFILLQPTSPLRGAIHIDAMIQAARAHRAGSALSVTAVHHHPHKMLLKDEQGHLRPCTRIEDLSAPRQSLPPAFQQNGAMYWGSISGFLDHGKLHVDPVFGFEMSRHTSVDIDDEADLRTCAAILAARAKAA